MSARKLDFVGESGHVAFKAAIGAQAPRSREANFVLNAVSGPLADGRGLALALAVGGKKGLP